MATPQTQYSSRVSKVATVKHPVPVLRSGTASAQPISSYGETKLITIPKTTGLWVLAQQIYGGNNLQIKERIRVLRQANPGWRNWPAQEVPGGTVLLLPPPARQFLNVPGAQKVIVDKGDGIWHILERHYRTKRGIKLSIAQIEKLVPTVAAINAIHDLDNELEPGWELYVPDEAVDNATGTRICKSTKHNTPKPDDPGALGVFIDMRKQSFGQKQNLIASTLTALVVKDLKMMSDLLEKKRMELTWVKDKAGNVTKLVIRGTNREALKALGISGTHYRVGSEKFVQAMEAFSKNTGTVITRGAQLSTVKSALPKAGQNFAKSGAWGAVFTVAIEVGTYVINGQADKIVTTNFGLRIANNTTNAAIASGAGTLMSAATVAGMGAMGGSVVPGIGTAVGFVVGLGVGAALSAWGPAWWGQADP
jgi:hypothetical protein